jgi:hypothetical protein
MPGLAYHGHFIELIPEPDKERWVARVCIEVHTGGRTERIYYRDHTQAYGSREEAERASVDFGKRMIDNFIVPASGEGDYQDPGGPPPP